MKFYAYFECPTAIVALGRDFLPEALNFAVGSRTSYFCDDDIDEFGSLELSEELEIFLSESLT